MLKSKVMKVATTFLLFAILLFFFNINYAKSSLINNKENLWKVAILSDTKELKDTQEIKFKVEDNSKVTKGKIAPGVKAKAKVEIDITDTKVPVDIKASIDDNDLNENFRLTYTLDGEAYQNGTTKTFELENNQGFTEKNGKKILELELEWTNNTNEKTDNDIEDKLDQIKIPITINVTQHIK